MNQSNSNHCGIVYSYQGNKSIGEIIKGLILIWELLEPSDMDDKILMATDNYGQIDKWQLNTDYLNARKI